MCAMNSINMTDWLELKCSTARLDVFITDACEKLGCIRYRGFVIQADPNIRTRTRLKKFSYIRVSLQSAFVSFHNNMVWDWEMCFVGFLFIWFSYNRVIPYRCYSSLGELKIFLPITLDFRDQGWLPPGNNYSQFGHRWCTGWRCTSAHQQVQAKPSLTHWYVMHWKNELDFWMNRSLATRDCIIPSLGTSRNPLERRKILFYVSALVSIQFLRFFYHFTIGLLAICACVHDVRVCQVLSPKCFQSRKWVQIRKFPSRW